MFSFHLNAIIILVFQLPVIPLTLMFNFEDLVGVLFQVFFFHKLNTFIQRFQIIMFKQFPC